MIKFKNFRIVALALSAALMFCSCQNAQEIPELIEPAVGVTTFRPVTRENIGDVKVILGTVTPKEYCHYYKKIVKIDEICVELGQYVEKGDVLAKADIDSLKSQLEDLNAELKLLNDEHDVNNQIYESQLKMLDYEKNWTEYKKNLGMADDKDVEAVDQSLEIAKENHAYDEELYEYMKKKYGESIADLNEMISDGTLKAKHSGYVTYIKSFKNGNSVGINENVVIVSDYEDTYIKSDIFTHVYQYRKYECKYALVHGKEIPIEEYDYTDSEVSYAKSQKMNMVLRFNLLEDSDLKVGDRVAMTFRRYNKEGVLTIGKDSSYADEEGTFVYVKADDGEVEKRYYEAGINSQYEIEVLSGLEEGELVMYEQSSAKPTGNLEEIEAKLGEVSTLDNFKGVKRAEKQSTLYTAPEKGVIKKLYVRSFDEVKKGDPLYEIEIDSQKGKLTEINNKIKHLKQNYEAGVEDYNKQKKDIEKAISDNKGKINELSQYLDNINAQINSGTLPEDKLGEAYSLKSTYEYTINALYSSTDMYNRGIYLLEEDLKVLENNKINADKEYNTQNAALQKQYNEQKKLNNGTGYKTVYAEADGEVNTVKPSEGNRVEAGDEIILTANYYDDLVCLGSKYDSMPVGYQFKITDDKNSYTATCVSPVIKDAYVFTEDGKVCSTYCATTKGGTFTTKVDDEKFFDINLSEYKAAIDVYHIDSFIVVPGAYVFSETDFENKEYFFVWKKENDEIIKKYIQRPEKNLALGNDANVVVISGIDVGDILVKQGK